MATKMLTHAVELMEATADLIYECDYTDVTQTSNYEYANMALVNAWNSYVSVGRRVNVTLKYEEFVMEALTTSDARMDSGSAIVDVRFLRDNTETFVRLCQLKLIDIEEEGIGDIEPCLIFQP